MKFFSAAILATSVFFTFSTWADTNYNPGTYQIDPAHSKVGFEIPHLVISSVDGRFQTFEGKVTLDAKFEKSKVNATVEMSSIDTGNPKRDDHLRSPDFFDVAKFKQMKFESKSIVGTPQDFKMTGTLTMKGVTKPVSFDGKYLGTVNDGYGNEKAVFTAEATIKRSDFGLTWNKMVEAGPVVGDSLKIQLRIQAAHPAPAKAAGAKPAK